MSNEERATPEGGAGSGIRGFEALELELLRRQAGGAAHTLNNLFTSLLGEVALLGDECKEDPAVLDAVASLHAQLERCVRTVRNGLPGRAAESREAEVDLGLLLSHCRRVLDGTLSRSTTLRWNVPDASWVVRGDPQQLETLILALTFRASDLVPGGPAEVAVSLADGPGPNQLSLHLDVEAPELPRDARQRLVDPALAGARADAEALRALHAIADGHGTHLGTERTGPESLRLSLPFERLDA